MNVEIEKNWKNIKVAGPGGISVELIKRGTRYP